MGNETKQEDRREEPNAILHDSSCESKINRNRKTAFFL